MAQVVSIPRESLSFHENLMSSMGLRHSSDKDLLSSLTIGEKSGLAAAEVYGLNNQAMTPIPGMHMNTNVPSPGGMS